MGNILRDENRTRILATITPSKSEILDQQEIIKKLTHALEQQAMVQGRIYSFIEAQGSTGKKQTQLKDAADIDLFVGLRPDDYSETLLLSATERHRALDVTLNDIVEKWFIPAIQDLNVHDVQKTFSQHPYLSLKADGLDVDILCCFDISQAEIMSKGPITAVDRTVHHSRYIADNLTEKMREDVRLLKSFVRASHAYGDMCAVGRMGFTGYALELLVVASGSLDGALKALAALDQAPHDPLSRSLKQLKKIPAFRNDIIFIIDPVDIGRNVASSFSRRAYSWLKKRIQEMRSAAKARKHEVVMGAFLERPIPTDILPDWLVPHALAYEFASDGSVHYTVLRDKLYRLARKVSSQLKHERTGESRFGNILTEVYFEDATFSIGFLIESPAAEESYERRGPPAELTEGAREFRKTHKEVSERDGFLWTIARREWTDAFALADNIVGRSPINGLTRGPDRGIVSTRVLNALYLYAVPVERVLLEQWQGFKEQGTE